MNWDAIAAVSEIFGAIAVLLTLIFLARQMQQTNKLGQAEAERDWFASWHDSLRSMMGSIESAELMRNGLNHYEDMSPNDKAVFSTNMICLFDYADVGRRLNKQGFVADDIIDPVIGNLIAIICTPGGAAWWKQVGPRLTIYKYFDALPRENVAPLTDVLDYFAEVN